MGQGGADGEAPRLSGVGDRGAGLAAIKQGLGPPVLERLGQGGIGGKRAIHVELHAGDRQGGQQLGELGHHLAHLLQAGIETVCTGCHRRTSSLEWHQYPYPYQALLPTGIARVRTSPQCSERQREEVHMARRSKVDLYGLLERIIEMFEREKMPIRDIELVLREEGFDISRAAIQRSLKKNEEVALNYKRALDESRMLLQEIQDNPGTDILELTQQMLGQKLSEYVRSIDELEFKNAGELIESVASISRAQVNVGRLKMEFQAGVKAAKKALEAELKRILMEEDPATLLAVLDAIERTEVKAPRGRA
ncbi:hypothetical protein CF126_19585 [Aeromonas dhakensis]|nr:hypothetical protein CF126_19585 [Aeromonas dhakensis]